MTTPPSNTTVTPTAHPVVHRQAPAAPTVSHVAAPPARPATPPPTVRVAPTPPPAAARPPIVHTAPPVARPVTPPPVAHRQAPLPAYQPRSAVPQQRPYYAQQRPYYSQPSYNSSYNNSGFLPGFLGGTALGAGLASLFGRRPQPSYGYGQSGAPYGNGTPTPDSMTPSKFTSFMNAAIEGRENDRTTVRSGDVLPTTPAERQYFKQVVFAMAQRDGKQIDPQGLFTPEALRAVETGRMDPRSLGSDLRHFSDSFGQTAIDSRGREVQSPLANDLYNNYDYLRSQYASEYRQSQQYEAAQQRPPQQYAGSYQSAPTSYYSGSGRSSVVVPVFSMPVMRF